MCVSSQLLEQSKRVCDGLVRDVGRLDMQIKVRLDLPRTSLLFLREACLMNTSTLNSAVADCCLFLCLHCQPSARPRGGRRSRVDCFWWNDGSTISSDWWQLLN